MNYITETGNLRLNAIAWTGLKETVAWDDSSVDQDQINNLINFAIDNETHNCNN